MRRCGAVPAAVLAACALGAGVHGQVTGPLGTDESERNAPFYRKLDSFPDPSGDGILVVLQGLHAIDPDSGLEVRAERIVLELDSGVRREAFDASDSGSKLPRRGPTWPRSRRRITGETIRERIERFFRALGARSSALPERFATNRLELLRSIYIEGGLSITREGMEVLRAERLVWSLLEDRLTISDAVLRVEDTQNPAQPLRLTIRTPRLARVDGRFIARDARVATDPRAEPTIQVHSDYLEVAESGDAFEITARENELMLSGAGVVPLPDQNWRTDSQTNLPIESFSVGFSNQEGLILSLVLGGNLNETARDVVRAFGFTPSSDLQARWRLGRGLITGRGIPVEPQLNIESETFEAQIRAFFLEDRGMDRGFIRNNPDGSLITEDQRRVFDFEGRTRLGESTRLDLQVFDAGDAGVYAEFYRGELVRDELPETALSLRNAVENRALTLTGRFNLADFAYTDDREIIRTRPVGAPLGPLTLVEADRGAFVEELPRLTYDIYAQDVGEVFGQPVLLGAATDLARFRRDRANGVPFAEDETTRLDQWMELSSPFVAGPVSVRPFVNGRFTFYEDGVTADSDSRVAFMGGVEVGTQFSRVFSYAGAEGETHFLRHVINPTIRYEDTFGVSDAPTDFFQIDRTDAITEMRRVRVGLLQRLQQRTQDGDDPGEVTEMLWVDLAQNLFPDADRDNNGEALGTSEFEVILREAPDWIFPFPVRFVSEGEYDWMQEQLRTFNNYVEIQTGAVRWFAEYRTDFTEDGQVGYGIVTPFRGRFRILGRALYSLDESRHINYTAEVSRFEPDYSISSGLRFDNIREELSFTFDVELTLGGAGGARRRRRLDGADGLARQHPRF